MSHAPKARSPQRDNLHIVLFALFCVLFLYAVGKGTKILGTLGVLAAYYGSWLYFGPTLRDDFVDLQCVEGRPRLVAMIVCAAVLVAVLGIKLFA